VGRGRPSEMEWTRCAIRRFGLLWSGSFRGFCSEGPSLDSAFRKPTRLYPPEGEETGRRERETEGPEDVIEAEPLGECVTNVPRLGPQGGREGPFPGPYTTGHAISDATVKRKPVLEASPIASWQQKRLECAQVRAIIFRIF